MTSSKDSSDPAGRSEQTPEQIIKSPKATEVDTWDLQADRTAIRMALVDCLRLMAGHYGRRVSSTALTAGLPIPPSGMTPNLLIRAAARADLSAKLVERSLDSLAIAPNLPCILTLEEGQACVLWEVRYPQKNPPKKNPGEKVEIHPDTRFLVQFPETSDEKKVLSFRQLERLYSGSAFFVRQK